MANAFKNNVHYLDTAGSIVSKTPLCVRKIVLAPNAAGDSAVLHTWDETSPLAELSGSYSGDILGTISSTTTLTMASGSVAPAAMADGYVMKIYGGTGTTANRGYSVITTAGNNTVVVCANAEWTNEASKLYAWYTYPSCNFVKLLVPSSDKAEVQIDFGDTGFWVPNLTLETLSSSATVYLYLR